MKRVLVADDTKNIRLLLTKCLQMEGYEVITANDGREAVQNIASTHFDLAFLDIKMPHMSGTEVLKQIREKGITMPVIIITAYATVKNAVECTQMGAVAYLQKPFTAEKIRNVLNELRPHMSEKSQFDIQDADTQDNTSTGEIFKVLESAEISRFTNVSGTAGTIETVKVIEHAGFLITSDHCQEALSILKTALTSDPLNAEIYLLLSKASIACGEPDNAKKYLQIHELLKQHMT